MGPLLCPETTKRLLGVQCGRFTTGTVLSEETTESEPVKQSNMKVSPEK